jgi:hypothetical protein
MTRGCLCLVAALLLATAAHAASDRQPAPPGAFEGAPPQYTKFSAGELTRGFLALAFGSDLRIGVKPRGIRRFDHDIKTFVISGGSVDRKAATENIIAEYGDKIPRLKISSAANEDSADVVVHLIDEKNFGTALVDAFGPATARTFVARTDPQCMTSVKSQGDGAIVRTVSFVIVDKGDKVFRDCAYHELLHAFGLSNHDQHNPWTTLNQARIVGYLSIYDRALLTLLYDPQIKPGMTRDEVRALLPRLIGELGPITGQ